MKAVGGKPRYFTISSAETWLTVITRVALAAALLLHPLHRPGVERRGHQLGVAPVEHVVDGHHGRHRGRHGTERGRAVHQVCPASPGPARRRDELAERPDEAVLAADRGPDDLAGNHEMSSRALLAGQRDEVEAGVHRAPISR